MTEDEAKAEVVAVARELFAGFGPQFMQRLHTVIGAPAVLAALGAVAHKSMSWSKEPQQRSVGDFIALLSRVNWSRNAEICDGIAGKATSSGHLSLAGGVKDNGSKTAAALDDPFSDNGMRIRRKVVAV